jgi:hypothetical protein
MGVRDTVAKALMGIKAYHSSPHDFDRFDLSKIGTGEGAQAYGHGLYFAENPAVSGQGGQYYKAFEDRFLRENKNPIEGRAFDYFKHSDYDRDAALKWLNETLEERTKRGLIDRPDHAALVGARDLLASGGKVGPRTYEVNIKADPAQMLDWDKPTYKQTDMLEALQRSRSPRVREVAKDERYLQPSVDVYGKDVGPFSGGNLYNGVSFALTGTPTSAAATNAFNRAGAPGIKYLDEGSRALAARANNPRNANWMADDAAWRATPPTSNYVVFDPDKIDILKKYGVVGAPTAALAADQMGSTFEQRYYGAQ